MRGRITKRTVDALKPGPRRELVWDSRLPGFGVLVTPNGVTSYIFQYSRAGRSRRVTIGRHGAPWTPDAARSEAEQLRAAVAAGKDPAGERLSAKRATTVRELCDLYLERHAIPHKKPASVESDRRLIKLHILPRLGGLRVPDVTRADIASLQVELSKKRSSRSQSPGRTSSETGAGSGDAAGISIASKPTRRSSKTGGPVLANRALALLSKMFNLAEAWGLRPDGTNPCRHVQRSRERRRGRLLTPAELSRLGAALREAESNGIDWPTVSQVPEGQVAAPPIAVAALRFLLLTGCRKSEVLTLRWAWVDAENSRLMLPDSKTGEKVVPLGVSALGLLEALPRTSVFVFPGLAGKSGHLQGLTRVWYRIRARAEIGDTRIHDLRHCFASIGASSGETLTIIGALLGHSVPATTARYQHLSTDPLRGAADRISGSLAAALEVEPPEKAEPKVVSITEGGRRPGRGNRKGSSA